MKKAMGNAFKDVAMKAFKQDLWHFILVAYLNASLMPFEKSNMLGGYVLQCFDLAI